MNKKSKMTFSPQRDLARIKALYERIEDHKTNIKEILDEIRQAKARPKSYHRTNSLRLLKRELANRRQNIKDCKRSIRLMEKRNNIRRKKK